MNPKDFGAFIKHHRLASGYKNKRSLAEAIGVSESTVSRMEAGLNRPTPETIQALSKRLHTTSLVELMVVCGYWDEEELLEPIDLNVKNNNDIIKETPSQYGTEKEFFADMKLLNELKELANEYQMDLRDPETLKTLKDALDLIKRVRGE